MAKKDTTRRKIPAAAAATKAKAKRARFQAAAEPKIKWTLLRASIEFGVSRETLRRGLTGLDIDLHNRMTFTTLEIFHSLAGDLEAERIRETRARADLLELERKEKVGDLVALSEVQTMLRNCLLPVRQRLFALPSEVCTRVNPTDPQLARAALSRWVDEALPLIREELPKPHK